MAWEDPRAHCCIMIYQRIRSNRLRGLHKERYMTLSRPCPWSRLIVTSNKKIPANLVTLKPYKKKTVSRHKKQSRSLTECLTVFIVILCIFILLDFHFCANISQFYKLRHNGVQFLGHKLSASPCETCKKKKKTK